jgi:hypothetical protein
MSSNNFNDIVLDISGQIGTIKVFSIFHYVVGNLLKQFLS